MSIFLHHELNDAVTDDYLFCWSVTATSWYGWIGWPRSATAG